MSRLLKVFILIIYSPYLMASENYFAGYALGISEPSKNNLAETKLFNLGIQRELGIFESKLEMGLWADSRKDINRLSSGYGSVSLGVSPKFKYLYIQSFWGVGLITKDDSLLSGGLQFMHDFDIGLKGSNNIGIGLFYKHISNAGIRQPNRGRDFLGIKLTVFND